MLFVLVLGIVGITFTLLNKNAQKDSSTVLGQADIASIPYIISLPPIVGFVGVEYVYDVKYTDNDSSADSISVSLENGPEWLHVEGKRIYGIPPVGSEGQYKLDIKVSDGKNSSVQENYILIQENAK